MVTTCPQCGDKGWSNAFVYCIKCLEFPVHRYCIDRLPETFDEFVPWVCDNCKLEVPKEATTKRRSAIRSLKKNHTSSERVQVFHSTTKLKSKDTTCLVTEREEHGCQSSPSLEPSKAHPELDSSEHAWVTGDCSSLKIKTSNENIVTCSAEDHGTSMELNMTENAQGGGSPQRIQLKKKLDIMSSAVPEGTHLAGDCLPLSIRLKRRKGDPQSVAGMEGQSSPLRQLCEAHRELDSNKHEHSVPVVDSPLLNGEKRSTSPSGKICGIDLVPERKRRLISGDVHKVDKDASQTAIGILSNNLEGRHRVPAQPVIDPIWKGSFSVCSKTFDGLVAHLSSKACSKVCEEASLLPALLCMEMLPKIDVWPKSFVKSEPNDDNIALYFFPESTRHEKMFDCLVDDMLCGELAIRAMVKNAELLVFASVELPLLYWRFQGKYYLWGVFKDKKTLSSQPVNHQLVVPNGYNKSLLHSNGVGTGEVRTLSKSKNQDAQSPLSTLSNNDEHEKESDD